MKARRQRELEAAERAVTGQPDPDTATTLLDLLPCLQVSAELLREESFRELLEALHFDARFDPQRKALGIRVVLHPDLLTPPERPQTSPLLSVHPTGQKSKKCPQVEGHVFALSSRHAKLRRAG